jgi:xylulokinase
LESIDQIRASGGGTKGVLWRQILASVLGGSLSTVNTSEGAAFGAALLAGVGAGAWADVKTACSQTIKITGETSPDPEQVRVYEKQYLVFRNLYPALEETFKKISGFNS